MMPPRVVLSGDLQSGHSPYSSSWGSCCFISILNRGGPLGSNLPKRLKKFKTNKTVLIIVIGLQNVLCWNLVKSALDKEDNSVPVYTPFLNFFFVTLVCDVFV